MDNFVVEMVKWQHCHSRHEVIRSNEIECQSMYFFLRYRSWDFETHPKEIWETLVQVGECHRSKSWIEIAVHRSFQRVVMYMVR